jgi:hypothetical protein
LLSFYKYANCDLERQSNLTTAAWLVSWGGHWKSGICFLVQSCPTLQLSPPDDLTQAWGFHAIYILSESRWTSSTWSPFLNSRCAQLTIYRLRIS